MDLRYWDAGCWCAELGKEAGRYERTRSVLKAAEGGRLRIVTSAISLIEVIKLKGGQPLTPDVEPKIRGFFKQPYIIVRNVDRKIGEYARELIWNHGVQPKDAIHLATALLTQGIVQLDTFDEADLVKLSGKLGTPPLAIGFPPLMAEQLEIDAEAAS